MIEHDDYGYYEQDGGMRRYLRITGERAERRVVRTYPQQLSNKKHNPYRKYSALSEIRGFVDENPLQTDTVDHIDDALDSSLPLPVRRMHYDIVGSHIFTAIQNGHDEYTKYLAIWKDGGGL